MGKGEKPVSEHDKAEINKVHDKAHEESRLRDNVAIKSIMSGEDFAAAYGLRATGMQQVILNGATPRNKDNNKTFELLLFMGAFDQALNDMLDDMQDILDRITEHTQQAEQGRNIRKSGNNEDATLYLLQHGYTQDDIDQMDQDQRMQAVEAEAIGHERTIDDLKHDYQDLLEKTEELLKNKPHMVDEYMPRVTALQQESLTLGIDFHDDVHKGVRKDRIMSGKDDHALDVEVRTVIQKSELDLSDSEKGFLVSRFKDHASGEPSDAAPDLAKEGEQQLAFRSPPPSAFTR